MHCICVFPLNTTLYIYLFPTCVWQLKLIVNFQYCTYTDFHGPKLYTPSYRLTVMEAQHSAKHREARRLLQRFLSGAISKNYPHSNTFSTRRAQQPTYDLSTTGPKLHQDTAHIWRVCRETVSPESTVLETSKRKTVMNMTKLPLYMG